MFINYSNQKVIHGEKSVFLAGPTPRSIDIESWRKEAISILKQLEYDGIVYIPEHQHEQKYDYIDQVEWEREALNNAGVIVFWVPRELNNMPAFTTNTEFGYYISKSPNKIIYGRPNNSPKNKYLDWLYKLETTREPNETLLKTLEQTVDLLNDRSKNMLQSIIPASNTNHKKERTLKLNINK